MTKDDSCKKNTPIVEEAIDGWSFSLRLLTHETKALYIIIIKWAMWPSMSFHPQQTLLSLGYHGSFCTTFEWISVQKVFILMYLRK